MVSDIHTEIERGTVQWKPDPKERKNKKGEPFTSYQIKVNDEYFDCNQKIYNAVRQDEAIEFTYSTRHWEKPDGSEGTGYKISDLIGAPETLHDTVPPPNTSTVPRAVPQRTGMIGSLPGAEVGAMENRAWQVAIALAKQMQAESIDDEEIMPLLMQQAYMGSWFKAQQIPSADDNLEPTPLQDDPPFVDEIAKVVSMSEAEAEQRSKHGIDEPDWSDGPDPTGEPPW